MELSILIAKIVSVVYLSAALGGFLSADYYRRLSDDMYKNAALSYMMGFTAVIVGALLVNYHNFWVSNWTVLITLIGWAALIKGVVIIVVPGTIQRLSTPFFSDTGLKVLPYVMLLLGLLFGYFGFWCGGV